MRLFDLCFVFDDVGIKYLPDKDLNIHAMRRMICRFCVVFESGEANLC